MKAPFTLYKFPKKPSQGSKQPADAEVEDEIAAISKRLRAFAAKGEHERVLVLGNLESFDILLRYIGA